MARSKKSGGSGKSRNLKPQKVDTIQDLNRMAEFELRKEYSRLRSIANKRLERLKQSEFAGSEEVLMNLSGFPALKSIGSRKALSYYMQDVEKFLAAKKSTVSGQKSVQSQTINTLHQHGYSFVNKSNLSDWGEFMEFMRALYPHRPSASSTSAKAGFDEYKHLRSKGYSPEKIREQFEDFQKRIHPDTGYLDFHQKWEPVEYDIPEEWR